MQKKFFSPRSVPYMPLPDHAPQGWDAGGFVEPTRKLFHLHPKLGSFGILAPPASRRPGQGTPLTRFPPGRRRDYNRTDGELRAANLPPTCA
jgi:hypothetical protein